MTAKAHETGAANSAPDNPGQGRRRDPLAVLDRSWLQRGRIVIIGLGGIGSFLARLITLFMGSLTDLRATILLVDGDAYEPRNKSRMEVTELANKASVCCRRLTTAFGRPKLFIRPVETYVNTENVERVIENGDVVFSCVDNHATRKLLSDRAEALADCVLISGGNDGVEDGATGTAGNVQVHVRQNGENKTVPLTQFHPEIRDPGDEVPGPSCTDLALASAPQIVFTNFFAAAVMGAAFYRLLVADANSDRPVWDEACFDIFAARMVPHDFG